MCTSFYCGSKLRYLGRKQADTERSCSPNTERPRVGLDRSTLPLPSQSSLLNSPKELTMNVQDMLPFQLTYQSPFFYLLCFSVHPLCLHQSPAKSAAASSILQPEAYCGAASFTLSMTLPLIDNMPLPWQPTFRRTVGRWRHAPCWMFTIDRQRMVGREMRTLTFTKSSWIIVKSLRAD